ncbi:MAG: hypothetical protein RJA95_651 [Verrucomicrobiota bacterium]|jgi:hypothetical protein
MKVTVFGFVAFAVVVLVAARGAFEFLKKLAEESSAQPPSLPPAQPRRARRARANAAKPAPEPEPAAPVAAPAAHLDASSLQVTRPARARSRAQFFGRSALRQAIVAREVLGPPLSLRPPRF